MDSSGATIELPPASPATLSEVAEQAPPRATSAPIAAPVRIAIVGVPNVGKSLLYRRLTGQFVDIGNYPNTTTDLERARIRLGERTVEIIDTPGTNGFELGSAAEVPTRTLLESAPPDLILQCADAGNLTRSLVLTAQLADFGIPMVLALNMVDEALGRGFWVDGDALSGILGIPVVATCAVDGRGIARLSDALMQARTPRAVDYPPWLQARLAQEPGDRTRAQRIERIVDDAHADSEPGLSAWHMVLETHHDRAREIAAQVVHATGLEPRRTLWQAIERIALHPIGGWLLLCATLIGIYALVVDVGVGILSDGLDRLVATPITSAIASWLGPGTASDILVGDYGLLSLGLLNAVCTVLPILTVFYLAFGLLEDIGYFPLLSVQLDRLLRSVGLTGRAVLPITLGFGCNAVATLSARSLPDRRHRLIACFLIALGVPCAVQLGVMLAIVATVPIAAVLALLASVTAIQLATGALLARALPGGPVDPFLVELPPLRPPRLPNILAKTRHRLITFFVEACPMFVASAALFLALHYTGLLYRLRDLLAPVVERVLGLPRECADMLMMTLARREVGALMLKHMADAGALSVRQIFVGLLVMILFVPCMNNTLLLGRVVGWRRTAAILIAVVATALLAGGCANALWP